MSHVQDLYRQEAMGLVSSREFDRLFDDAVEQDMVDASVQKNIDDAYEEYIEQARKEYYDGLLNAMTPHERKHSLNPSRMDLKGGHTHKHVKNAHKRMKKCNICGKSITKYEGFSSRFIGHICMECYIEECREHAVMAGIPTIGSLFDELRNPYIRCK